MLSASSSFRHLRYAGLCTCRYSFSTMFQRNPAGQKMHVIEWGVCRWQTVLYTWLNLNRRLNFVLCSGKICVSRLLWRAHMIGAGEEDYLAALQTHSDTIDRKAYFELAPRFQCFDLSSIETKIVGHTGEVKHWWRRREYSISGSLEIQDMVRGYSFDIRFTLGGNIQSGYSEHGFPSSTHTRAHLVPNQGSSRPAFASRLKWDRVSLMGIRVEFETKCQCLYWSLIESLGKQKFAASDHPESPFLQKVGSGSGPTVSFPLIWLWQTGQPLAGC